jgi:hypothetical protein
MIKSLCDVRKIWDFSRSVTNCTLHNCVSLNRHETFIPKHLVILHLWAYLKTVTTVLSLCPPSQQEGSEVDRSDSPIKLSSTKKKRRRILSDSEEQDVDASSRFVYGMDLPMLN